MLLPLLLGQGTGAAEIVANLSVTDAADALASSVALTVVANLSRTDAADALTSSAAVSVQASATATDASDLLSAVVLVAVVADLAITDTPDALDAGAVVDQPSLGAVMCALDAVDDADQLAAVCMIDQPEQSHNGRDWRKFDVLRPVRPALAVSDEDDRLLSVVLVEQLRIVGLSVQDADDVLLAIAAVAWPQAQLVMDSMRLKREPVVKLIRTTSAANTKSPQRSTLARSETP